MQQARTGNECRGEPTPALGFRDAPDGLAPGTIPYANNGYMIPFKEENPDQYRTRLYKIVDGKATSLGVGAFDSDLWVSRPLRVAESVVQ